MQMHRQKLKQHGGTTCSLAAAVCSHTYNRKPNTLRRQVPDMYEDFTTAQVRSVVVCHACLARASACSSLPALDLQHFHPTAPGSKAAEVPGSFPRLSATMHAGLLLLHTPFLLACHLSPAPMPPLSHALRPPGPYHGVD